MMGAMGRLLFLVFLADLALLVIALIDCLSTDGDEIRALPKAVWVLLILFASPLGPIAYWYAGRPRRDDGAGADAGAPAWHPAGSAAGRAPRDLAPDDNPEFLRELSARTRRTEEERLRRWEAELRRREEELRRDENGTDSDPPTVP
jgi:hypothetical protein